MDYLSAFPQWPSIGLVLDYSIKIFAIGYVPEGRRPSSSNAWLLLILLLPIVGLPLFFIIGSPYINRRRHRIQKEINNLIEDVHADAPSYPPNVSFPGEILSIFQLNRHLTNMPALACNFHGLFSNYEESIQRMTAAVDEAKDYVHVEIYIMAWDKTTEPFYRALERAVKRGVPVKLLFDHVGSWKYPGYHKLGKRLSAMGIDWHLMLPLQPWKGRFRRPDLRNHRKMLIIDGETGFMGSQNMIDSSYLMRGNIRAGRHWIDAMVELSGPIVASMDTIFAGDWYSESSEVLRIRADSPELDTVEVDEQNTVQLVPSGPGYSTEPNLRMFDSIVHHAKTRLVLCSPYFIPDESLLYAVTSACYRGVRVELLVSEQADQFAVDHAQSSYYQSLLEAGVHIYMYPKPAILHTKFILADPDHDALGVIGSSNMDMRSFGLNYEVSLMVAHGKLLSELDKLATKYKDVSIYLTLNKWNERGWGRRYVDNVMRLTSALQ